VENAKPSHQESPADSQQDSDGLAPRQPLEAEGHGQTNYEDRAERLQDMSSSSRSGVSVRTGQEKVLGSVVPD